MIRKKKYYNFFPIEIGRNFRCEKPDVRLCGQRTDGYLSEHSVALVGQGGVVGEVKTEWLALVTEFAARIENLV